MKNDTVVVLAGSLSLLLGLAGLNLVHAAVDSGQAEQLIESNKCSKCHAPAKSKSGPSWKKIAAKHKGEPDAEDKLITHMTTGAKVKLDDGTEEEHKIIKEKDPAALKNLAQWILAH